MSTESEHKTEDLFSVWAGLCLFLAALGVLSIAMAIFGGLLNGAYHSFGDYMNWRHGFNADDHYLFSGSLLLFMGLGGVAWAITFGIIALIANEVTKSKQ